MRWLKPFAIIFLLAWILNIGSCAVQGSYQGVIGNVCGTPETNNVGDCYEALPTGGFPITYAWDSPVTSVIGSLGVEDIIKWRLFWLNFTFYLVAFTLIWKFLSRRKVD